MLNDWLQTVWSFPDLFWNQKITAYLNHWIMAVVGIFGIIKLKTNQSLIIWFSFSFFFFFFFFFFFLHKNFEFLFPYKGLMAIIIFFLLETFFCVPGENP